MKPLAGFSILDVGTMTPGKYCSYLLADLGADVIRVERPISSPRALDDEDLVLNQGKRSMTINLRSPAGLGLFLRLAEAADVVLESNRPGTADRNGFGFSAVHERNPQIVYCALSGYGATGPLSQAPGYDLIFAAQSGMLRALTGRHAPLLPGTYLADGVAGLTAAYAIIAALLGRERSGEGTFIDLAMHDSIFALLAVSHGVRRPGAHAEAAEAEPVYELYAAADGTYLALGAIRPSSARALFDNLGRPELASGDVDAAEIRSFLTETFAARRAEAWVEALAPLDVEIARVNEPLEAFDDPQLKARNMIGQSTHREAGDFENIQPPLILERTIDRQLTPAPAIGEDTEAILKSLGLDERAINELADEGAI
jgi:crotonobetainyl-CoA:carnitine CoA-transferase CaiB-like acyl-CoA transferase